MFLNPFLLFGLAAVSVPVIIHLLNRRRFQRVTWAAMRFVRQAVEQNQRRIRVEDLILLIVRCVLVALIALALAKPVMRAAAGMLGGGGGETAVIVLDNSASMSQRDGPASRFEQAKTLCERVLDNLPKGSAVALVLASDVADAVIPEPTLDLDAVRKAIAQAALTDRASDVVPALKKGMDILSGRASLKKEVYVVTDSQRLAWRQTADAQKLIEENRKDVATTVVFAGEMTTRNLAVTDLRVDSEIAAANQPLRFNAQVTNFGTSAVQDVEVSLRVDNDPAIVAKGHVGELRSGEKKSVLLSAKIGKEGYHAVTASVPKDDVPADDARSLALHVVKQVQVLLVEGEPGREPRESKTFFLRHVLQPVDPALRENYFIQTKVVAPAEIAGQRLDSYDVVMLANVADLPAVDLPAFERFVKNGGGLVVFPGANLNAPFYNEQLFKKRGLLPAAFGEARGDASQNAKFWTFQSRDFAHPISEIWNQGDRGNPATAHFYRVYDLQPPTDRTKVEKPNDVTLGEPRVVINYNDGKPAIMEHAYGMGRVVQFSSGADTAWNDLPVRAKVYVPLMMRTVGALVGREDELLNIRAGERLAIQQPGEALGKDVLVTFAGDDKAPPQSTRVEAAAGGIPMLRFDKTDRAGVYTATVGSEAIKFAAAPNAEESAIEPVTAQQIKDIEAAGATTIKWQPGAQIDDAIRQAKTGTELWFPLAVAALALAVTETVLAHAFSRPK